MIACDNQAARYFLSDLGAGITLGSDGIPNDALANVTTFICDTSNAKLTRLDRVAHFAGLAPVTLFALRLRA